MKKGLIVADSGPIFSLAILDKLSLLDSIFSEVYVPNAVWDEITFYQKEIFQSKIYHYFKNKIKIYKK